MHEIELKYTYLHGILITKLSAEGLTNHDVLVTFSTLPFNAFVVT